jgi:hypothetical protein
MVGHNEYGWQRSSVSCKLQFRRFTVDEAAEKQAWQGMLHLISKAYICTWEENPLHCADRQSVNLHWQKSDDLPVVATVQEYGCLAWGVAAREPAY